MGTQAKPFKKPLFGSQPTQSDLPNPFNQPEKTVSDYYQNLWGSRKTTPEELKYASENYSKQLALVRQLSPSSRKQVFDDLKDRYIGTWRRVLPLCGKSAAGLLNGAMRLPLHGLSAGTKVLKTILPVSSLENWLNRQFHQSDQNSATRRGWFVGPFERLSVPAALDKAIENLDFFQHCETILKHYGTDGHMTAEAADSLLETMQKAPETLKVDPKTMQSFIGGFPVLQKLSDQPHTVSLNTLGQLKQNVKDSIPFLYEQYGQSAQKYLQANLVYLSGMPEKALPTMGSFKKAGKSLQNWLDEYPTYRKFARFAKKNQLSDTQFLPLYSLLDAVYGQGSGYVTNLVKEFSLKAVFKQMVELDGIFNGVNFWVTKLQILLIGWDKEKPDKQRAQFEKQLKSLAAEKEKLTVKLDQEREALKKKILAEPEKTEALTEAFNQTILEPLIQQTQSLEARLKKYGHQLNKLTGVEKMGFWEQMWKKPPQLLDDLKVMVPISVPLSMVYEYNYVNRYTDYKIDFFSARFAALIAYMTLVGAFGNIVLKQIIHLTQDRSKLYLEGKKDELMATKTRESLANMNGVHKELSETQEPTIQKLAHILKVAYQNISAPLIGDESEQASTEKTLNREAKLQFSIERSEAIGQMLSNFDKALAQQPKGKAKSLAKTFRKYLKLMHKVHERIAYIPLDQAKFELASLADFYRKEIMERDLEKDLPSQDVTFFKNSGAEALAFLEGLARKYPKAEQPFEPLSLRADTDQEKLRQALEKGIETCQSSIHQTESLQNTSKASVNVSQAAKKMIRCLKATQKVLQHDLKILSAKSQEASLKELDAYREERKRFAAETQKIPFGVQKLKRKMRQAGMAVNQGWKKAYHIERYYRWLSGLPWIPSHSLVNVAGRIGFTSIVQDQLIPFPMMLKVWLLCHIPVRFYAFFSEKSMVVLDEMHQKRNAATKKMENGMEAYLQNLIAEEQQKTKKTTLSFS